MTTFPARTRWLAGGWSWDPVTDLLPAAGHQVIAVTLAGLEERHGPAPNLDTHIDQVTEVVRGHDLNDRVLCGHSYAGTVITEAADRGRTASPAWCTSTPTSRRMATRAGPATVPR